MSLIIGIMKKKRKIVTSKKDNVNHQKITNTCYNYIKQ